MPSWVTCDHRAERSSCVRRARPPRRRLHPGWKRRDSVVTGQELAACGNSGNSTQPHVHVQAMDDADAFIARGLTLVFKRYRVWPRRGRSPLEVDHGIPNESEFVKAL